MSWRKAEGILFPAYMVVLAAIGVLTVGQIGVTWDEPNYFTSTYSYFSWFAHIFEEPSEWWSSIDRYWSQSHEAPPFLKLWAGLSAGVGALVFGTESLDLLGDSYRLGSYALFLVSVWAAFRFIRGEFGPVAGWGAALSLPLIPVLFGFARLGQLDGAAAAMYLVSAVALHGMLSRGGRRRTVIAGVLLGLAFATKLSVFTLVPAAILWTAIYHRGRAAFTRLFASFCVGAATFFAIWPWLWRAPIERTWEFLTWAQGLEQERFLYYFGEWWAGAPWHYPLVALVALVPLVVALAGVVGVVRLLRSADNPAAGWVMVNIALVVAVAGSGLVPIYGGPRQLLPAFGLWALCAGVGVGWISSRLAARLSGRARWGPAAVLAVYVALALPGILWTGTQSSLEYYGGAVGFIPGAHALGFETTYLADTYKPAVEYVNEVAPESATVYVQAGTYPVAETYRRVGELRGDLRPAYLSPIASENYPHDQRPREDSYFLFLPRQSIYTDQMLALAEKEPLYAYEKGGVPLVKVYSGEQVAGTLDIEGAPEPVDVGLASALAALGVILAVLAMLVRGKQYQGKKREE